MRSQQPESPKDAPRGGTARRRRSKERKWQRSLSEPSWTDDAHEDDEAELREHPMGLSDAIRARGGLPEASRPSLFLSRNTTESGNSLSERIRQAQGEPAPCEEPAHNQDAE